MCLRPGTAHVKCRLWGLPFRFQGGPLAAVARIWEHFKRRSASVCQAVPVTCNPPMSYCLLCSSLVSVDAGGEAAAREGLDQPFSEDEYSAKTDEIPIGSCPPLPSSLHEQRGRPENQPEGSGLDQPFSEDEYARDR